MVTTNNDVKLLVRARWQGKPAPAESALAHGWRGRHVLPVVQAVLEGRQGLRVGDLRSNAPFAWDGAGPPPRPTEAAAVGG
jgi:hypothetical protein